MGIIEFKVWGLSVDSTLLCKQRGPMFAESLSFAVSEWEKTIVLFFHSICVQAARRRTMKKGTSLDAATLTVAQCLIFV